MADAGADESTLLEGRLRLRQPLSGHRSGLDAILLAACAGDGAGVLADIGAGAGAAGLAAALDRPQMQLILVEREPLLAGLAQENAALNAMADRTRVICADMLTAKSRAAAGLENNCADILITNPPWLDPAASRVSPDGARARAHTVEDATLGEGLGRWLRACAALLRPSGRFAMIHRADALEAALAACEGRFGGLHIRPVHPRTGEAAIRVLICGVKGSRAPLKILPGLAVHGQGQAFTAEMAAINAGGLQLM